MNTTDLHEMLTEAEALMLEPHDLYGPALVGAGWRGPGDGPVAVYDMDRVLAILAQDMGEDGAEEWFEYNVVSSWVGPATPIFIRPLDPALADRTAALRYTPPAPEGTHGHPTPDGPAGRRRSDPA